jgi:ribonuclease P protein component
MTQMFPSSERIKSRKVLEILYAEGEQIVVHPFRLRYKKFEFEKGAGVQAAFSVPKRNVKKAVNRNKIKRQIKEAYRLNKKDLLSKFNDPSEGLALFLIYIGKEDQSYQHIERKLKELLKQLQDKI